MADTRPNFDEAVFQFREFLRQEGWSEDLCWLTRDHITGYRTTFWIYRPDDLISDVSSRQFYEYLRQTANSIRIDAFALLGSKTLVYVQNWGGEGRHLNWGIPKNLYKPKVVFSRMYWWFLRWLNRIRGEASLLKYAEFTKSAISKDIKITVNDK